MCYVDVLLMADNIMMFWYVIKEVVIAYGVHATFMFKLFWHQLGSGMHTHLLLFEGDCNVFYDPFDELYLFKTACSFIFGLFVHVCEIIVVIN